MWRKEQCIVMRKILVVVDMQNDFIDGALGTKEAENIIPSVIRKIKEYEQENVYATRDTHETDYLATQEGKNLPVEHCIRGTKGWEIRKEIAELLKEKKAVIIDKPSFGSLELAELLYKENEKEELEIELIGLCTDICVVSNALLLKAKMPETKISADAFCCAGVTVESHLAAIETMKMCQINIE